MSQHVQAIVYITITMASATCELVWIKQLLQELKFYEIQTMKFYCDNQTPLYMISNPVFHERAKHIEIDCIL